jgi:hypothetical protein
MSFSLLVNRFEILINCFERRVNGKIGHKSAKILPIRQRTPFGEQQLDVGTVRIAQRRGRLNAGTRAGRRDLEDRIPDLPGIPVQAGGSIRPNWLPKLATECREAKTNPAAAISPLCDSFRCNLDGRKGMVDRCTLAIGQDNIANCWHAISTSRMGLVRPRGELR